MMHDNIATAKTCIAVQLQQTTKRLFPSPTGARARQTIIYVVLQDTSIRNLRLRNLAERYVFRAAGTASISAHKKNLLNLLRNFAMQPVLVRDAAPSSFQSQHQMESYRVSSELKVRIEP